MPKALSKKLTTQKDNQPTPAVNAHRRGRGAAKPQENATGGIPDDSSGSVGSVGLKTASRRSSRLQHLSADVASAAAGTTGVHPTGPAPTAIPSRAPKGKRSDGTGNKKNPQPALAPEIPPTQRNTPPIPAVNARLSPLTDEDEENTNHSKGSTQPSGTADIDQEPQTDGEDTDDVPPPPKRRRIPTQSRGGSVAVSQAGSSSSTQSRPAMSVRSDPSEQNESMSARIHELMKELNREKEKNRLLRKTAKTDDPTPKLIPRPKGGVGAAGYQLMAEMGLERTNIKERMLYNNILASVRGLMVSAGIDFELTYKEQSMIKMGKLFAAAREKEPYLARFENDWATGQIIRQCINGKRKFNNRKSRKIMTSAGGKDSTRESDENDSVGDSEDDQENGDGDSERDYPDPIYSENHGALTWGNEELTEEEYASRIRATGLYMMDD